MGANLADVLLQHYVDNSRPLPWRSPPGEPPPDPYRVWLSEVMLQQTTAAAVAPRFERFIARWPTLGALAKASDTDILSEWAGLGYYARARNLIACAREVAGRGEFPTNEAELRQLPGIGEYTAAAIAAIAFDQPAVVVDSNVERIAARLNGLKRPSKVQLREAVTAIMPSVRSGDFAQAMMDLGATICRPRDPQCGRCPLAGGCKAHASGEPELYPERKARKAKPIKSGVARWTEESGSIWLVRRPPSGLLGGMAALPGSEWTSAKQEPDSPVLARVRHHFTHFTLDLAVVAASQPVGEGWWQPTGSLADAGLPTLYRRAVQAVLAA